MLIDNLANITPLSLGILPVELAGMNTIAIAIKHLQMRFKHIFYSTLKFNNSFIWERCMTSIGR